jgi:intraflagellar transport protein 52
LISNGILNRAVSEAAGKSGNATKYTNGLSGMDDVGGSGQANAQALSFLYPYGATLNVARPAVPVLSTGSVSFPLNRPVCALYSHPGSGGKLAVLGSGAMFADQYIGKEHNNKF